MSTRNYYYKKEFCIQLMSKEEYGQYRVKHHTSFRYDQRDCCEVLINCGHERDTYIDKEYIRLQKWYLLDQIKDILPEITQYGHIHFMRDSKAWLKWKLPVDDPESMEDEIYAEVTMEIPLYVVKSLRVKLYDKTGNDEVYVRDNLSHEEYLAIYNY